MLMMDSFTGTQRIPSPCIRLCTYDDARGYCLGCFRTLQEITTWSSMTDPQRIATLEACERRREGG